MDYRDREKGVLQNHFWFRGKSAFIEILLSRVSNNQNTKILNVGAGTGEDISSISKFGNVYAIDIDAKSLVLIPDSSVVEKKTADACNISYKNNFFDIVVAFDVIEHVKDDQKMIDEVHRVLKPQGSFIFTAPAFNFLFGAHDRALHHHRRYNKKMVHQLFKNYEQKKLGHWFFFLFFPAVVKRLLSKKGSSSSMQTIPALMNNFLFYFLKAENWLINKGIRFPVGLSVYGIYQKR